MGTLSPSPFAPKIDPRDEPIQEIVALRGTVTALSVTDGEINLLAAMQSRVAVTGTAGIAEGLAASVAGASMGSMDGGEFVQHFECYIGTDLVIGTFENVGFEDGDDITVFVTRIEEGAFFAHAALRTKDGMLWMPHSISKGRYAVALWITKFLGSIGVLGLGFLLVVQSFIPAFDSRLELVAQMTPALMLIGGFIGYMTYRSSIGEALYAERILKAIGFKSPWRVNLSPFSDARLTAGSSYQVYDVRRALAAYGKRQ